ncbi:hypothetical protein L218DRAFT_947870 [Marasmius fiardii PR-910]|nr:hypothetical protein L218DRAFT_947870 [Marasmius fiardii PR-910]
MPTFFENTSNAAFRDTSISNVHRDQFNNGTADQYTIHNYHYSYITNNHNYYGGVGGSGRARNGGDTKVIDVHSVGFNKKKARLWSLSMEANYPQTLPPAEEASAIVVCLGPKRLIEQEYFGICMQHSQGVYEEVMIAIDSRIWNWKTRSSFKLGPRIYAVQRVEKTATKPSCFMRHISDRESENQIKAHGLPSKVPVTSVQAV